MAALQHHQVLAITSILLHADGAAPLHGDGALDSPHQKELHLDATVDLFLQVEKFHCRAVLGTSLQLLAVKRSEQFSWFNVYYSSVNIFCVFYFMDL